MRHVDDAHHAEGDGKTDRGQQQHRAERKAVPGVLHGRPQRKAASESPPSRSPLRSRSQRLIAGQSGQQRQRFLIAACLDGGDGFKLFDLGGIGLEQQDRRARLGECQLRGLVGFLRQGAVDHRQHGLVVGLEHRLRRLHPFGRIGRQQRQSAKRRLDDAAQLVVETHRAGAVRHAGNGGAGRGVDDSCRRAG